MKDKKRIVDFHVTFAFVESVDGVRRLRIYKAYHLGLEIYEKDLRLGQTFGLDMKRGGAKGKKEETFTFNVKVNDTRTENCRTLLLCRAQSLSRSDFLLISQHDGEGRKHKEMEDILEREGDGRYEIEWGRCLQRSGFDMDDKMADEVTCKIADIFRG